MSETAAQEAWLARWMQGAKRSGAMSQRRRTSVEKHGGGLHAATQAAKANSVHLLLLTDENGKEIVAASSHPFRVLT